MDDDFSAVAYAHLVRVLEDLKDEQATMHSSSSVRMGKSLEWNDEEGETTTTTTGKVIINVRNATYLSVNVTVKTACLWKEYMDRRERMGIRDRFYFDEDERVDEFPVRNTVDLARVTREMRYLNFLRRRQIMVDRMLVLAMGAHSRLGADSQLLVLDENVLKLIGLLLLFI